MADRPLQNDPGTYALLLRADREQILEVGALGEMTIRRGAYLYVGSAHGPGGVRARVERHARADGTTHWHVDYLRAVTTLESIWYTYDGERRECTWSKVLRSLPGGAVPLEGFGASDCGCSAHLFRFDTSPSLATFRTRLSARCPDHAVVEQIEHGAFG